MLHYRATSGPTSAPEPTDSRRRLSEPETLSERIILWLTYGILSIVLAVWAVVGAIFWIPLLLRTMVHFSVSLIQSTMDAEKPEGSARTLRDAVTFYRRGFVVAVEAVLREDEAPEGTVRRESIDPERMKKEVLWAVAIWYLILWPLGVVWSPAEMWAWFVGLPWGETFESVVQTVTGGLDALLGGGAASPPTTPTT
jgi:hypothetical protein